MFIQKISKSSSPNKPDLAWCVQHLWPRHGVPRNADLFIVGLRIPSWGWGIHRASVQSGQFGKAPVRCVQALQVVCVGTKPPAHPRCRLSSVQAERRAMGFISRTESWREQDVSFWGRLSGRGVLWHQNVMVG